MDFTRNKYKPRPFINRTIISNSRTDDVVLAAFMDTYLTYADPLDPENRRVLAEVHHAEGVDPIQSEKVKVGRLMQLIKQFNDLTEVLSLDPGNIRISLERAGTETEIRELKEYLGKPETLFKLKLTTNPDTFLEVLMGNVKGNVISFQHWVKKTENSLKARMIKHLYNLKLNYAENCDEIQVTEERLCALVDRDLEEKVKSMKLFECINAEKPTPLFMSLAKTKSVTKQLSVIKMDDGTAYGSSEEQIEGIVSYFENLYRKPRTERVDYTNCISDFLGEEIINNPLVQGSMLTENEKTVLDRPLTRAEIDKSMEQANFKSAPGIDGISNIFLSKYWDFFGEALFKYAIYCYDKGTLTANFKSASIKLIPKKGELEKLKNWRPISLLSNMYKIISRAINNRLNAVVNRVCSRAQKGFNDARYTQEVLINVIETIRYCNNNNVSSAVVAVDMAKAFDTLSHGYLTEVFKFFNFGPNIIRWLNLLGTGRHACIALDDGTYSRNFDLERGRAQGDNISPNTFNFGDQILILKIELDPGIAAVWQHFQQPNFNMDFEDHFSRESARETGKNESMADDNTTITVMDTTSLRNLRNILDDFAEISGLVCNYDKTSILPVGPEKNLLDTAGFQVVDKIKLLGMDITKNFDNTDEIFGEIHEKIKNLILFWERFRLSLPGRISVVKNLLIPQLNYLGSFLAPGERILNSIQLSLDRFALNGLNVSMERRYLPPGNGGLGLFKLKTFLDAQRCSWIKRAHVKAIDNWRFDLKNLAPGGNISLIRRIDVDKNDHPILYNLVDSYCTFLTAFSDHEKNYQKSEIFYNPTFVRSRNDNNLLDIAFFTADFYNANKNVIRSLTYEDCFSEGNFKSKAQFAESGIRFTDTIWMRLQSALVYAKTKYSNKAGLKICNKVGDFLTSFKKGSKKFRKIILQQELNRSNVLQLRTVVTYANLTDTEVPSQDTLIFNLKKWNCGFFPNDLREFIFKEINNCLPLGNRIGNYIENVNEQCSFCRIINPETNQRENFNHIFLDCPVTRTALNGFLRLNRGWIQGNYPELKQAYWYGIVNGKLDRNMSMIFTLFRFCIWKCKIRKKIPRAIEIFNLVSTLLRLITSQRPKIHQSILHNNTFANLLQAPG
jgi:hypothetical protein